ncbi:MAG TPA: hypothetical protein VHV82_09570 [Sporichthyaceae bacterium]|nr:hypothetical protein [Sporichthyaceae bacterium]
MGMGLRRTLAVCVLCMSLPMLGVVAWDTLQGNTSTQQSFLGPPDVDLRVVTVQPLTQS